MFQPTSRCRSELNGHLGFLTRVAVDSINVYICICVCKECSLYSVLRFSFTVQLGAIWKSKNKTARSTAKSVTVYFTLSVASPDLTLSIMSIWCRDWRTHYRVLFKDRHEGVYLNSMLFNFLRFARLSIPFNGVWSLPFRFVWQAKLR